MKPRLAGVYRERLADTSKAAVLVVGDGESFHLSADRYVAEGYQPPFNTLPWREDYELRDPAQ